MTTRRDSGRIGRLWRVLKLRILYEIFGRPMAEEIQQAQLIGPVPPRPCAIVCPQCRGNAFTATTSYGGGQMQLECTNCGMKTIYWYPRYQDEYVDNWLRYTR